MTLKTKSCPLYFWPKLKTDGTQQRKPLNSWNFFWCLLTYRHSHKPMMGLIWTTFYFLGHPNEDAFKYALYVGFYPSFLKAKFDNLLLNIIFLYSFCTQSHKHKLYMPIYFIILEHSQRAWHSSALDCYCFFLLIKFSLSSVILWSNKHYQGWIIKRDKTQEISYF